MMTLRGAPGPEAFDRYADRWAGPPAPGTAAWREATARWRLLRTLCDSGTPRVLELGCGTGWNLIELAPFIERGVGVDFAPRLIERARANAARRGAANLEFVVGEILELDVVTAARGPFDLIVLAGVLGHVPDQARALEACRRRVAADGRVVVIMPHPANPVFLWTRLARRRVPRLFPTDRHLSPRALSALARRCGLAPRRVHPLPCRPVHDGDPSPPGWVRAAIHALGVLPFAPTRGAYALVLRPEPA